MVLNNADNIMFGSAEVDRVYCGIIKVWERGGSIPSDVISTVQYVKENYFPETDIDDLAFFYAEDYNSVTGESLGYKTTVFRKADITSSDGRVYFHSGGYSYTYVNLNTASTFGGTSDTPFYYGVYGNVKIRPRTLWCVYSPVLWTRDNPFHIYGNFPQNGVYITNYSGSKRFFSDYIQASDTI